MEKLLFHVLFIHYYTIITAYFYTHIKMHCKNSYREKEKGKTEQQFYYVGVNKNVYMLHKNENNNLTRQHISINIPDIRICIFF